MQEIRQAGAATAGEGGGYRSMAFAHSLGFAGRPFMLEAWGTPVLLREIEGAGGAFDAAGVYPLCQFGPEPDLEAGLGILRALGAVSVVLVADPLGGLGPESMQEAFGICRAFKTHHVWDPRKGPFEPSRHHRERIRRGRRRNRVRRVSLRDPAWLRCWTALYAGLVDRKALAGLHGFPPGAFAELARLPEHELVAFAAEGMDDVAAAMQLWIVAGGCAYSHLTAASPAGHRSGAVYALQAVAAENFAGCQAINFGGGAGLEDRAEDGLAAFKRGFANAAVTAHLCGSILDPGAYAGLSAGLAGDFFPLYRRPGG